MPLSSIYRLFTVGLLCLLLCGATLAAGVSVEEFSKMLPNKVGNFKATGAVDLKVEQKAPDFISPALASGVPLAARSYVSASGEKFEVQLYQTQSDAAAYSLLTSARATQSAKSLADVTELEGVGTAAIGSRDGVSFFKGASFVFIKNSLVTDGSELVAFARALAEPLDAGSGEIPVLIKHLPDWETARQRAGYAVTQAAVKQLAPNQPVLDVVSLVGGTEAVAATYDQGARLVIVEYTTPQFALDADAAVTARIAGLRGEGKAVPSAYSRVGNYAVFVFDAPDETAAKSLIDRVKYEKAVQWLGEDPFAIERHNRAWLNMSTSVIVNTVKVTGIAIALCLGIGGVLGGWVFMRRRAQSALTENFSDAGGMMRLNLDEMNVENNASRLLGHGDKVR